MPELAEVETVRRQIDKILKNRKIKEVIFDPTDRFMFAFAKPEQVKKALQGAKVLGTGRRGKYFWIKLDRKPWPIIHLGMSGNVAFLEPKKKNGHQKAWGGAALWNEHAKTPRERLWFSRLLLIFQGGFEMAVTDPRRFGRMWLAENPEAHPKIRALGFDPLIDFPKAQDLFTKLQKRKKAIKSVLLDQSLFAGIGNWLADEILYHARLSPHRTASQLTAAEVKNLHKALLMVVKKSVAVGADYEKFPKNWLFHHRWGKSKTAKTSRGQKIIHEDIGARTAAWVPDWQK